MMYSFRERMWVSLLTFPCSVNSVGPGIFYAREVGPGIIYAREIHQQRESTSLRGFS